MDPWIPILKNLKLSRVEQRVIERYEASPNSRLFLPVSDVLRNHSLVDESLEMLMKGIQAHPRYTAARVILARDLLNRGMPQEAWEILEGTVDSLKENILAQRTKIKVAILLGKEFEAREIMAHLRRRGMIDAQIKPIVDELQVTEFQKVREKLRRSLIEEGVPLHEPEAVLDVSNVMAQKPKKDCILRSSLKDGAVSGYDEAYLDTLKGYHMVSIKDLFSLAHGGVDDVEVSDSVTIDSATLAEIYEKQRYFKKALGIYRSLLDKSPQSEWLREKVSRLVDVMENDPGENTEVLLDCHEADSLVALDVIDEKLQFLNDLLKVMD